MKCVALDSQLQAVIEAARGANAPRSDQLPVMEARALYRQRYRSRTLPADPAVLIRPLTIPGPDGDIVARLYRPANCPGALPLIIYFHGGGFVLGDVDAYEPQSTVLAAQAGSLILFVEFRLAPEHRFPAAVEDAVAAVRWAKLRAQELGADPRRVAVMGDSAGANLAINTCLATRTDPGPPVLLQCLLYPAVDYRYLLDNMSYPSLDEFANGFFLDRTTRRWFFDQYFANADDAHDSRASVLDAPDLSGLPLALVVTAECDPLRDLGKAFHDRLIDHGVRAEYRCIAGMIHNFLGYTAVSDVARQTLFEIANTLRTHLREAR